MDTATRRKSLAAILISITVAGVGWGLSSPIIGLLMNDMGASRTLIGLNTAVGALSTLVYIPFAPLLMKRFGIRQVLAASLVLAILAILAFKLFQDIWLWFPIRFLFGVGLAGIFIATEVWINMVAVERTRGRVLGLYSTGLAGGFALGVGILSVTGTAGWLPFLAAAALMSGAFVVLLSLRVEVPSLEDGHDAPLLPFLWAAPSAMGAALVFGAVEMGILNLIPVYGVRAGLEDGAAARLLAAAALGNILLQLPIGWLADRIERRLVLALCALVGVVGALILPFLMHLTAPALIVMFLTGGTVVGLYTVGLVVIGERFTGSALAGANAAFILMYGFGSLVGPPAGGVAMDWWDPHGLMVVLAALCLAYLVVVSVRIARGPDHHSERGS